MTQRRIVIMSIFVTLVSASVVMAQGVTKYVPSTPENVVWGNLNLYEDISMKESNFDSNTISKDERKNHLNDKNNYNMYLFLKDIIDKDDFTPREVKMEKYFK